MNAPVSSTRNGHPRSRRGQKAGRIGIPGQGKSPRVLSPVPLSKLPRHSIRITARELVADVELIVGRCVVAETTLDRDVTRKSAAVGRFVRGYFHAPSGSPRA